MTHVRKATIADVPELSRTLARAFQDDPAFSWAAPNAARRERFGPPYFELLIRRIYLPKSEVYMTEDRKAAALWAPPGKWQSPASASLPLLPVMWRACGSNLPLAMKMVATMEARHEAQEEPHYYLPFIGTDPEARQKGHGTALLKDMVGRCDDEGVAAYLESTSLQNQALYHRHGFQVLDEMHWPKDGPAWWPMWREPRRSAL